MKSLSVFQAILLAVFGALAVSGILVFALFVGGGGGGAIGPITIWGTLNGNAFAVVIRQAAENDSRLAQVTYVQKDPTTYESELTDALAAGQGPDLFLLRQDYAIKDAGKIQKVPRTILPEADEARFKDTFIEAAGVYAGTTGILGIPLVADPLIMYWNRDMFSSAGFARPPQTWGELNGIAQRIVKRNDAGTIEKAAVAFGEYANVDNAKDILSMLILQAGGRITLKDSTGRLAPALSAHTGEATQATESALRFYTEFADPSKTSYSWNRALPGSRAAFTSGDLALYFGYASEAAQIASANPNLNFAIAPMPQTASGDKSTNGARVYALAVTRTSKNPQGAITVAALLASAGLSQPLSVALGIPSARRDVLSAPAEGNDDLFNKQAIIARSWNDPDPEKTSDIFRAMIESVTTGRARLSEAVQRADQEMAEIIGQ